MRSTVKVCCVAPALLGEMWPHVGAWLLKGQLELTPDMRSALLELLDYVVLVHKGKANIWTIIDERSNRVVAAMITEIFEDSKGRVLWVSRMGGERILRWGKALAATMNDYAKAENCWCVRFWGRRALQRAYGRAVPIGTREGTIQLYEGIPA